MKWQYWLILELLIVFGVIAWVYFCPSEIEDGDFARATIGFILIYAIEVYRDINRRNDESENYTIEQNAGENQIESESPVKKTELKDQLESYEGYINDIPLVIDPCRMCKYIDANKQSHIKNTEICRLCCWYYDSEFEVGD